MKRSISYFLAVFSMMALLAGCSRPMPAASTEPSQKPPEQTAAPVIQAGTWFVSGKDTAAYYFFDADGTSGRTASLENGTGLGFTYSIQDNEATFHMGASDMSTISTLEKTDDTHFTITWEDGRVENMTYVSEKGSEDFQFYTNEDLCRLAVAYYTKATGEDAPQVAADTDPETVSIQLYVNTGDHNSNCAWYQVNRQTAKGTDVNTGAEIDLSTSDPVQKDEVPKESTAPATAVSG